MPDFPPLGQRERNTLPEAPFSQLGVGRSDKRGSVDALLGAFPNQNNPRITGRSPGMDGFDGENFHIPTADDLQCLQGRQCSQDSQAFQSATKGNGSVSPANPALTVNPASTDSTASHDGESTAAIRRTVFRFCRYLAAHGQVDGELEAFYKAHRRDLGSLGWTEFRVMVEAGVKNVDAPIGTGPLRDFIETARKRATPACAERYPEPMVKLLVTLCAVLQERSGEYPFYLAANSVMDELQVAQVTVSRWLRALVADGVLERVKLGHRGKASEYKYLGGSS